MWPAGVPNNVAGGPGVDHDGGPAPGQWPVNQNMYQNIPHEQIDWAALAQQWIQMREVVPGNSCVGGPSLLPPVISIQYGLHERLPPPTPPQHLRMASAPLMPATVNMPHRLPGQSIPQLQQQSSSASAQQQPRGIIPVRGDNSNQQEGYGSSGDWSNTYWGTGPWGPNSHANQNEHHHQQQQQQQAACNWIPPGGERKETVGSFDFSGQMHGNHGYSAQTFDYNHGTDHIGLNQCQEQGGDQVQFNQYWSSSAGMSGAEAPPFLRRDVNDFAEQIGTGLEDDMNVIPSLDAAKRKNLPAWIRDGLEKMERDKQRKLEREEMLKEREIRLQAQREEGENAIREFHARGGVGNVESNAVASMPSKSKFESDSEGAGSDDDSGKSDNEIQFGFKNRPPKSSAKSRTPSPPPFETPKTEQEKMEEMMIKVRRLLTEILLEVTSEEIGYIAKEVFSKARSKAPARQLANSSALASITGSLGLGGYSSDSDQSDGDGNDDDDGNGNDGVDSDVELQENIRRRRLEFAKREKELVTSSIYNDDDDTSVDSSQSFKPIQDAVKSENEVLKSQAQSAFEKKWYSEDKHEDVVITTFTSSTVNVPTGTGVSGTELGSLAKADASQADLRCSVNNGDDCLDKRRLSDSKRSEDRVRSLSRDRGSGGKRGTSTKSSHRAHHQSPEHGKRTEHRRRDSDVQHRRTSTDKNKNRSRSRSNDRDRDRDRGRTSRVRASAGHRRSRSRSTDRTKSRQKKSGSGSRRSRGVNARSDSVNKRDKRSPSPTSSSSTKTSPSRSSTSSSSSSSTSASSGSLNGRKRGATRRKSVTSIKRRRSRRESRSTSKSSSSSSKDKRRKSNKKTTRTSTSSKCDSGSRDKSGRSRHGRPDHRVSDYH